MEKYTLTKNGWTYLISGFYDCECDTDYIHDAEKEPVCPVCGRFENQQPDSMVHELLAFQPELIPPHKRFDILVEILKGLDEVSP